MKDAEVFVPIKCPECGEEWLEGFSVAVVADALLSGTRLRMRGRCHAKERDATLVEMEQIRQYLVAGCIGPRNAVVRCAAEPAARMATGPLRRLARPTATPASRPTYSRLARKSAAVGSRGGGKIPSKFNSPNLSPNLAAKLVSSLRRRLWVFELAFLRRER
jgi:hypothetical protein